MEIVRFLEQAEISEQPPEWLPDGRHPGTVFACNQEWPDVVLLLQRHPYGEVLVVQTVLSQDDPYKEVLRRRRLKRNEQRAALHAKRMERLRPVRRINATS
jgi:hypothetical protein